MKGYIVLILVVFHVPIITITFLCWDTLKNIFRGIFSVWKKNVKGWRRLYNKSLNTEKLLKFCFRKDIGHICYGLESSQLFRCEPDSCHTNEHIDIAGNVFKIINISDLKVRGHCYNHVTNQHVFDGKLYLGKTHWYGQNAFTCVECAFSKSNVQLCIDSSYSCQKSDSKNKTITGIPLPKKSILNDGFLRLFSTR